MVNYGAHVKDRTPLSLFWMAFVQEQYEFVHEAVCDFAMCGNTHIDATRFGDVLAKLMDYSEEGCSTNIEEQFQVSLQ